MPEPREPSVWAVGVMRATLQRSAFTHNDTYAWEVHRGALALDAAVTKRDQQIAALRELLWLRHGCHGLYGDDGEMQCGRCLIDFKREAPETIKARLRPSPLVAERDALQQQVAVLTAVIEGKDAELRESSDYIALYHEHLVGQDSVGNLIEGPCGADCVDDLALLARVRHAIALTPPLVRAPAAAEREAMAALEQLTNAAQIYLWFWHQWSHEQSGFTAQGHQSARVTLKEAWERANKALAALAAPGQA